MRETQSGPILLQEVLLVVAPLDLILQELLWVKDRRSQIKLLGQLLASISGDGPPWPEPSPREAELEPLARSLAGRRSTR